MFILGDTVRPEQKADPSTVFGTRAHQTPLEDDSFIIKRFLETGHRYRGVKFSMPERRVAEPMLRRLT